MGSLRGARTGLDAVAECDCCGTAVSAGWILPLDPDPTRAHTQQQSGAEKGSSAMAEVAREGEESVYAAVREARTEMCARLEEQLSEDWRKFDAPDENGERLSPPVPPMARGGGTASNENAPNSGLLQMRDSNNQSNGNRHRRNSRVEGDLRIGARAPHQTPPPPG